MDLVSAELPARTLVVAVDPGKVSNRVVLATGERGLIGEPVSLPVQREGIDRLCGLIDSAGASEQVIAIEATGSLHLAWASELERRFPGWDSPPGSRAFTTRTSPRPRSRRWRSRPTTSRRHAQGDLPDRRRR